MEFTISIDDSRCINCNKCVAVCPSEIFLKSNAKSPTLERVEKCIKCGHCVAICPTKAVCHSIFPSEKVHDIDFSNMPKPKQVLELIRARRSNRVFTKSPVSMENLQLIVEAGHRAPTGTNQQKVHFTVVTSPEKLHEIALFTINTFAAMAKKLENPFLKPLLKMVVGEGVFRYVPIFKKMEREFARGKDYILRGATSAIFIHTPSSVMLGKEDANLAYQNASLMAESLGVAQFYTGFVCLASSKTGNKKLAEILGVEGSVVHAGMALGMPKYKFEKYIDRKDIVVNYL